MAEGTGISPVKRSTDLQVERPPERSAEAIRQDIAARRNNISQTVDMLGERLHGSLDWRQQVGNHPFAAIAIAAAAGLILSRVFQPRPSPGERIMDAIADVVDNVTDQARDTITGLLGSGSRDGLVASTIAALTTKAAGSFIQQLKRED